MRIHGKISEIGRKQRHDLKGLFDQLDSDGSGVISIEELYEPLMSLGVVNNKNHVQKKDKLEKLVTTVAGNMKQFQKNDLPFRIAVCNRRRALMMQAYVSDNAYEKEKGLRVISAFASEINSSGSPSKNQRIYNRRISEFKDTKSVDQQKKLITLPKSDKRFNDSFMTYLPPTAPRMQSFNRTARLSFMKDFKPKVPFE